MEIHQIHLRPADFFTGNPAIDVPGTKNHTSVLANGPWKADACCENKSGEMQMDPKSHMQGTGPDLDPKTV